MQNRKMFRRRGTAPSQTQSRVGGDTPSPHPIPWSILHLDSRAFDAPSALCSRNLCSSVFYENPPCVCVCVCVGWTGARATLWTLTPETSLTHRRSTDSPSHCAAARSASVIIQASRTSTTRAWATIIHTHSPPPALHWPTQRTPYDSDQKLVNLIGSSMILYWCAKNITLFCSNSFRNLSQWNEWINCCRMRASFKPKSVWSKLTVTETEKVGKRERSASGKINNWNWLNVISVVVVQLSVTLYDETTCTRRRRTHAYTHTCRRIRHKNVSFGPNCSGGAVR